MDVMDDPSAEPGKLIVFLGGIQILCYDETECPGAAICAINQTWQASKNQGMCMCNSWFGFTGATCQDWCTQAQGIIGINSATAIASLLIAIVSMYLIVRFLKSRHKIKQDQLRNAQIASSRGVAPRRRGDSGDFKTFFNPVLITLLSTSIGSICLLIGVSLNAVAVVGFAQMYGIVPDPSTGRMLKRSSQTMDTAGFALTALGYTISTCAVALLPLTWLEITGTSLKVKRSNILFVMIFALIFSIFTLAVELAFYILIAGNFRSDVNSRWVFVSAVGWGVIFSAIIVFNILALIRVVRLIVKSHIPSTSPIRRLLNRIIIAAVQLIVAAAGAVVALSAMSTQPLRRYYDDPHCYVDSRSMVVRSGRLFVLYGSAVCVWFVYAPVMSSCRRVHSTIERAAQQRGAQERATQERGTQERATQERGTQERATQERGTQEKATQERATQSEDRKKQPASDQPNNDSHEEVVQC